MFKFFGRIIFVLLLDLILVGVPSTGSATVSEISLEFQPLNQTVNVGDTASVGIYVTNPSSTPITAVDFWVNYDSSIVTFESLVWANTSALDYKTSGDPNEGELDYTYVPGSCSSPGPCVPSNIWTLLVSAETEDHGNLNLHNDDFLLATINFTAVGIGTSDLWLSDAFGNDANVHVSMPCMDSEVCGDTIFSYFPRDYFLFDGQAWIPLADKPIETGHITVASATSVPEPGTALLLGFGLAALASLKKRIV